MLVVDTIEYDPYKCVPQDDPEHANDSESVQASNDTGSLLCRQ